MSKSKRTKTTSPRKATAKALSTGNTQFIKPFNPQFYQILRQAVSVFLETRKPLNRYVLTFAHAHLYKDVPRHCLVVKKAPDTLHAGLFNLPGGKIEVDESPSEAALRELKEETGLAASQPQLVGAILPSGTDANLDSFIVYIYRAIINPGEQLSYPPQQPASWELISDLSNGKSVPSLAVLVPLLASDIIGFIIQDIYCGLNCTQPYPVGHIPSNSQTLVSLLRHSYSDAVDSNKRQRFST